VTADGLERFAGRLGSVDIVVSEHLPSGVVLHIDPATFVVPPDFDPEREYKVVDLGPPPALQVWAW